MSSAASANVCETMFPVCHHIQLASLDKMQTINSQNMTWNQLDQEAVYATSINTFKSKLDKT